MGQGLRFAYATLSTIGIAIGAVIYYEAGKPLVDLAQNDHSGPMTVAVTMLDNLAPVVLAALLLGIWVWVFVAPVQQERARRPLR